MGPPPPRTQEIDDGDPFRPVTEREKNQERDVSFRFPVKSCQGALFTFQGSRADAWISLGLQPLGHVSSILLAVG